MGCDLLSVEIPLERGTSEATVNNPALNTNHVTPPLFSCDTRSLPLATSTAMADTNPDIAAFPFMISGAGLQNANCSRNFGN